MSYMVAIDLYQKLTAEWNGKPAKLDKCNEYLNQLKVNNIIFSLKSIFITSI